MAATAMDLERYKNLYKQPLIGNIIAAMSAMLDEALPVRKKRVDQRGQPRTLTV